MRYAARVVVPTEGAAWKAAARAGSLRPMAKRGAVWTDVDRASFERKQTKRERDQRLIDSGKMTALEVSRANAIATAVVDYYGYRPTGKIGLPR